MNYQKVYENLIEKAKSKIRKKAKGIYYENHHILPRCIGGDEQQTNKVLLTAKEHFVAHKLLTYIYPKNNSIKLAHVKMSFCKSSNQERIDLSSRDYEYAKLLNSEAKKGNKNRLGIKRPHSEKTKKHLSNYFKENVPKKAFKKGNIPWNKGLKTSEESKEKNRQSHLGKKMSEESKEKNRQAHLGRKKGPMTIEHKQNLSKSLKKYNDRIRRQKKK